MKTVSYILSTNWFTEPQLSINHHPFLTFEIFCIYKLITFVFILGKIYTKKSLNNCYFFILNFHRPILGSSVRKMLGNFTIKRITLLHNGKVIFVYGLLSSLSNPFHLFLQLLGYILFHDYCYPGYRTSTMSINSFLSEG